MSESANNLERYKEIFIDVFGVTEDNMRSIAFNEVSEWDSVGHMSLIAELEEAFDILIEADDMFELTSFDTGIEVLKKYGVEF